MLRKLLQNKLRLLLTALLVCLLVLIRAFESKIFYDPFLEFFKTDFEKMTLPALHEGKLFLGLFFRYFLNSLISLAIIYAIYKDKAMMNFAAILYLIFFVVLTIVFFIVLFNEVPHQNWFLFYIRRFIIQPLFLLLFLAGFYYQKQTK